MSCETPQRCESLPSHLGQLENKSQTCEGLHECSVRVTLMGAVMMITLLVICSSHFQRWAFENGVKSRRCCVRTYIKLTLISAVSHRRKCSNCRVGQGEKMCWPISFWEVNDRQGTQTICVSAHPRLISWWLKGWEKLKVRLDMEGEEHWEKVGGKGKKQKPMQIN